MHKDLTKELDSSFLSCQKDAEIILKKLFIDTRPHSDILKRLLIIASDDCIDKTSKHNTLYQNKIDEYSLAKMVEDGYIRLAPKIRFGEHEEVRSYIIISFDNFSMNETNPQFRDCTVSFDILCFTDYWDIGNYQIRPLKIAGYIDGILNETKLSGIGTFNFLGCNQLILDENISGYTLSYRAVHGSDDIIPPKEG